MKLVRRCCATSLFAVLLLNITPGVQGSPQLTPATLEGRPITAILFEPPEQPVEIAMLPGILRVHPGDKYSAAALHDSIEYLYATGRYEDIQIDATDSEAGVQLRYITRGSWFIGHVGVDGDLPDPPAPSQLVSVAKLELGMPFDEPQLAVAETNMLRLLLENGFFNATVQHSLIYEPGHQQVHIMFDVRSGRRAQYGAPKFTGDISPLSAKKIANATRWQRFIVPGYRGITQNRTRDGLNGIRGKFQNADHLLATVTLESLAPEPGGRRTTPHIAIMPGPVVEITAKGGKIGPKQIRQNVPVFEEHTVDKDLLDEGAVNLRDYLQARGYFDAEVTLQQAKSSEGTTRIEYTVEPGARHRLAALVILGNKYFDQHTIRERMLLAPKSFELRAGRYSETLRRRDDQTVTALYRSNGFRDVRVTSQVTDDYLGKESDLGVEFHIEEGRQYRVAALEITGAERVRLASLEEGLSSQRGQVFSEVNIAADRDTLLRHYGDNGFPNAAFQWASSPGAEPYTVNVRFMLREGEQQSVREIVTSGLSTTKRDVVAGQFGFGPGDPLSPAALAETQRRLYDLGIFARVNMAVQNPDGVEGRRTVIYDVEEASRYSITTGLGAEFARIGGNSSITDLSNPGGSPGFSPRFTFNVSRLNFLGRAQTLSFQSRLSTLQKRALASWFVPRIFSLPQFDATLSLFYDDTHDVRTFQARREEGSIQVSQRVSKPVTAFYRFTWRHVAVSNLRIDPLLLPRLAQSVRASIASFNLVQDRRDDPVDPHKGIYNTLDVGVATRFLGSQTSFVRFLGRNASYHRLGDKIVLARETQLGFEPAFHIPPGSDPTDPVPLPERFYGGGGNTLRAFPENQAGPRDLKTGFPLGGTALFFNNTELRFPLIGTNINGVLFEDAGNIYSSPGNISFRVRQRGVTDFNYMVHAAGFGIRYKTPVGPIRIDAAYSINGPQYNGFAGSYTQLVQCSALNNCQAKQQQISRFQFFFSIGQAF